MNSAKSNSVIHKLSLLQILLVSILISCSYSSDGDHKLPILGNPQYVDKLVNGKPVTDTLYHSIPTFSFIDQDSNVVNNDTFKGKIYIADFFFTSCPDICPVMTSQMVRIYEKFNKEDQLRFLSHTIDPKRDSVHVLKDYANRLGVDRPETWYFVTGDKDKIFEIAMDGYFVTTMDNPDIGGTPIHSGAFMLIDKEGRVRGAYDGTDPEKVDQLMKDIPILLAEYDENTEE